MNLIRVGMATHLRRNFDYSLPAQTQLPAVGSRVSVPFGNRQMTAIVLSHPTQSTVAADKLRPIHHIIDTQALLPHSLHQLLIWAADYYHYNLGDVYLQALPKLLRQGSPASPVPIDAWQITDKGQARLIELSQSAKAPKQRQALALFDDSQQPQPHSLFSAAKISRATLKTLEKQGWIRTQVIHPQSQNWQADVHLAQTPLTLNRQQAVAVAAINQNVQQFAPYLLEGITGSGKTEVYLQILEPILKAGRQALILVPEIGLTPQTIARFKQRFELPMVVLHSGLNDRQRLDAWLAARNGDAAIIIGTRSALFTPMQAPGIIIIDEEHDSSFKQQDTFRYHARDVALMRAKLEQIPVVMGTATPALETLHNALTGRYQHLELTERAGNAALAKYELIDIRHQPLQAGLSPQLLAAVQQTLRQGQQVMLFLNRRGYAPALLCHECGGVVECDRCERFYTLHQAPPHLACHHCGKQRPIPVQCQHCGSTNLVTTGVGTEQLESQLKTLFADYSIARIDRDSTRRKGSLDTMLQSISDNRHQILIGTQMLAKGHHFPNVTLVAIVDIDHALFSSDFRASERLAQLFIQVAGRAGRAGKAGKVLLQTHHPEHELLQDLVNNGYGHFARFALAERQATELPPFSYHALLRFEATALEKLQQLAQPLETLAKQSNPGSCWVFPMTESPIPKRAGKYRQQQLLQAPNRRQLHQLVSILIDWLEQSSQAKQVRWSVDIDPIDML
ncbi:primosomal protein N' [Celerinatantimonas yamalensis]|uniref:Replication restart protein PriA n=1 Tax=Celerinatantimonas yamalensis TaxID=559956 RepID=A0ABW9G9P0_9GAMM